MHISTHSSKLYAFFAPPLHDFAVVTHRSATRLIFAHARAPLAMLSAFSSCEVAGLPSILERYVRRHCSFGGDGSTFFEIFGGLLVFGEGVCRKR